MNGCCRGLITGGDNNSVTITRRNGYVVFPTKAAAATILRGAAWPPTAGADRNN
jgi:hypothetical protein